MIEIEVVEMLRNDDILAGIITGIFHNSFTFGQAIPFPDSTEKIYPIQAPQEEEPPYILYNVQADGTFEENLKEITLSFDCVADTYLRTKQIRDRISVLLDVQDKIRDAISSDDYIYYWSKKTGSTGFREYKDTELDLFHRISVYEFKYGIK